MGAERERSDAPEGARPPSAPDNETGAGETGRPENDPTPRGAERGVATGLGRLGWHRTVLVDGKPRPVASLLRRGAALAVDLCFAILAAAVALHALSFFVPLDTDRATGPILVVFGLLALYIAWLRDRGAARPGRSLRHGLSVGRRLLGLRLVPVAGPRRFTRPVTVADSSTTDGETMRVIRAVLLGVAATLVAVLILGHAVSRTVVFGAVEAYAEEHQPFAAERGSGPDLAALPSALVVGRSRAYVRVDAEWGDRADPLEFFLERNARGWTVAEVRIGEGSSLPNYALSAPDADVPVP